MTKPRRRRKHRAPVVPTVPDVVEYSVKGYLKRYTKGSFLGKGGFAHCYELTSLDTGNRYAGKVVPKKSIRTKNAKKKLINEMRLHLPLRHDNIVQFIRRFEDAENVYMLLELCENQSLMELSKRRRRLSEPEVRNYMWQLLLAVHYLHDNNIIHRDLKLGNLFLDSNMTVKVGDFGLATRLEHKDERKTTICGTPNYIAPEILSADAEGHSFEVDIWSMGVIMYTLLIGRPPFQATCIDTTYKRIVDNSYVFPTSVRISNTAKDLITTILHSRPDHRPTLRDIMSHSFFHTPFPKRLDESALHLPPRIGELDADNRMSVVIPPSSHDTASPSTQKKKKQQQQHAAPKEEDKENAHVAATGSAGAPVSRSAAPKHKQPLGRRHGTMLMAPRHPNAPSRHHRAGGTSATSTAATTTSSTHRHRHVIPVHHKMGSGAAAPSSGSPSASASTSASASPSAVPAASAAAAAAPSGSSPFAGRPEIVSLARLTDAVEQSYQAWKTREKTGAKLEARYVGAGALGVSAPRLWVSKWVDYSRKYGFGYLLSDGSAGVYFNDSSKMILSANSVNFEYVEKRAAEAGDSSGEDRHSKPLALTIGKHPESLKKKVVLLQHFKDYLYGHQEQGQEDACPSASPDPRHARRSNLVFVAKCFRTRNAIFFRLSNNTVQLVFDDETELILAPDGSSVTYTERGRERRTYAMQAAFNSAMPGLYKRMRYARSVLNRMTS